MPSRLEDSQTIHRPELLAGQIAMSMRQRILAGDWKPGERVVESRLAKELGVGQPTIREALVNLESVGLVTRLAVKGCVVTELTPQQANDLLNLRRELESIAIGLICKAASDDELAALKATAHSLKAAALGEKIEEFRNLDLEFHQSTWKLCGNEFLPRHLEQVTLPLLAFFSMPGPTMQASADGHLAMVLKLEQRDLEGARLENCALLDRLQKTFLKG